MRFKADEIASVLQHEIETYQSRIDVREVGRVLEVGDGIARVYGLSGVMAGEMVTFPSGVIGQAFNLDENSVGVIILGDFLSINEGTRFAAPANCSAFPWATRSWARDGPAGQPAGRQGPDRDHRAAAGRVAGPGRGRTPAGEPTAATGIKAIDAMTPIGRGQRELIIGDRKTGKTAICIDTILNQKGTGVKCFYVAIGQKESSVAGLIEILRREGAMDYTVVILAGASDPAPLQTSPLRRLRDGRVLHVQGRAHVGGLRRPLPPGPGLSATVASHAASAGTPKPTPATFSTLTAGSWSGRPSSATSLAPARLPRCRSWRRWKARSRPTFPPT